MGAGSRHVSEAGEGRDPKEQTHGPDQAGEGRVAAHQRHHSPGRRGSGGRAPEATLTRNHSTASEERRISTGSRTVRPVRAVGGGGGTRRMGGGGKVR